METYNLEKIEESIIVRTQGSNSISSVTYEIPVDNMGNPVEYLNKFRAIDGNQMHIFNDEQEYRTWLQSLY